VLLSTGTAWALFALAQAPEIQSKLRSELLEVSGDEITMDTLNSLPYLDAVVRETMRLHAPVPNSTRIVLKDDFIPLSAPIVGKDGKKSDSLL